MLKRVIGRLVFTCIVGVVAATDVLAAGALAINTNQANQFTFARGYGSVRQAEQQALTECGRNCKVVLEVTGSCGAYALDESVNPPPYGWASAASAQEARTRAVAECQLRGGGRCTVRSAVCDGR